ncbi:MAG: peptide chain release factor N(5)-glutamine methyltransferase [Cyanobacteriota bacterium]|nr:peptide chain release factor N(5)-glutamine methyltransferase [Cyanobacteriota bacterium]
MSVESHPPENSRRPHSGEGLPAVKDSLTGADLLLWRQELTGWGGAPGSFDWLLDVVAGVSPAQLRGIVLHPSKWVDLCCSRQAVARLWRRHLAEAVPLQYLVGRCFWRDFTLDVGPGVLIPRPETERMIDLAIDLMRDGNPLASAERLWADLGTGSGCLAMGLARAFPGCDGLAVDASPAALAQASSNLVHAGLRSRVRLIQGDWFAAVQPWWGVLSLVVANPPYIPSGQVDQLDPVVRDHEPRLALDGGEDGLACIRQIALGASKALAEGGWLLLEHHHDQSQAVMACLNAHGLVDLRPHADLEGHQRFVSGRRGACRPPLDSWRRS